MPNSEPWTEEEFTRLRQQTDPIADQVVNELIQSQDLNALRGLFNQLRENEDVKNEGLPTNIQSYFNLTSELPKWADPEKIKIGQQVYAKYGPQIALCLLCKSLPEAYACANGAKVLYATGRMTEHNGSLEIFTRRLMETSQFVVNVCIPGGLDPNGKGIITAQKVRLIHASIRYYIKLNAWPAQTYGQPINQMDMAGTLQSFSALTIQGLDMLKIDLSPAEKEGYYHCWRVVGHIIGLKEDLNPPTYQKGLALGEAILANQIARSKEGVELTRAVCQFMVNMLPGNIFKHAPEAIIRFLVGDKIADMLELEPHDTLLDKIVQRLSRNVFHHLEKIENKDKILTQIIEEMNMKLMQGMLNHFNDHKQIHFYVPPDLRQNWNLN